VLPSSREASDDAFAAGFFLLPPVNRRWVSKPISEPSYDLSSDGGTNLRRLFTHSPNAENSTIETADCFFPFVRRGTQSYDEFTAAIPLWPCLGMILRLINKSDIFLIGENAGAHISSRRTSATR
jgi:hypothetical protein